MREHYFDLPVGGLTSARSVLLDSNISSRVEHLHRRQQAGRRIDPLAPEMIKLRNLADAIPADAVLITGLSALEAQLRRMPRETDNERYNSRADAAAFYLSSGRDYLRTLLAGDIGRGLTIESAPGTAALAPLDPLRRWMAVSYSALLKAVEIHLAHTGSAEEKVDAFRFFLERDLKASPSREGWVGFLLLGGLPESKQRARRLLKIDSRGNLFDNVWGATWDLWYTRMPTMVQQSIFQARVKTPLTFVTDDDALIQVVAGLRDSFPIRTALGTEFGADQPDFDMFVPGVRPLLAAYMARDGNRVITRSRGIARATMRGAQYEARQLERAIEALMRDDPSRS
ncbi:hypothetical protein BH09ACT4_BH09ACT4_12550 [soil metagenome]